jgi:hypothetical protein
MEPRDETYAAVSIRGMLDGYPIQVDARLGRYASYVVKKTAEGTPPPVLLRPYWLEEGPMAERDKDGIREASQRPDHRDREHGPMQEAPEPPPQIQDYDEPQPIEHGRQPDRPGQPGRWEPRPGERDKA